jgi:hypothetical protein
MPQIVASLTDNSGTLQLPTLEIPLRQETMENAVDVQTLDFNVYTDFINSKRRWTIGWSILTETEFNELMAFYQRQFTDFQYPVLSIPEQDVDDVTVRMYVNTKDVVTDCGEVANFQVTFRETAQMPSGSS